MKPTTRETLVGCIYCATPTLNEDKVCDGPSCRRLHGAPIYQPEPTYVPVPGRRIVTVRAGFPEPVTASPFPSPSAKRRFRNGSDR